MAYLDTSVLVAYYCPEALSAKAEREIQQDVAPTISPLTEVEFYSALSRKTRIGELSLEDANRMAALFELHLGEKRYIRVPVTDREYVLARNWIARFSTPLRTLDGIHLAAAFANKLELVTTDKGLAFAAKHCGVQCRLIC
jgi:predicted nucleic acid-binding protein